MKPTYASLFTGGGLADVGAIAAGYEPIWGIELDPNIAHVAESNLNHRVYAQSVTETDWSKLEAPDTLWASPPCPNFSVAKTNRGETDLDRAIARSVCDAITTLMPRCFVLENVEGYRKSESFQGIVNRLHELGYWTNWSVLNAADFGVPQTRRRLILRAIRGGFLPELPLAMQWKGWYQAIEDLIATLPETQFAEWQLKRMPEGIGTSLVHTTDQRTMPVVSSDMPAFTLTNNHKPGAFLVPGGNASSFDIRTDDEPARTVVDANRSGNAPRAFLVDGIANDGGSTVTVVEGDRPSYTVKASAGKQASRAWLEQGRIVQMTPRALARFQTLPDWYELPGKAAFACKIIGNGVPCLLAESVLRGLAN